MNVIEITKRNDINALVSIMMFTSALCYAGAWQTLNACLESLEVEESSSEGLVSWLRTTWLVRDKCPAWKTLLLTTHAELLKRNIDADETLRGLLQL